MDQQENNTIRLLSPRDIQSIFRIGKNQAYALMHSSGFPTITLNSRMYVEESAMKEWIERYKGRRYLFSYE